MRRSTAGQAIELRRVLRGAGVGEEGVDGRRADGNSGFGWMLVIVGLVIARNGLIWVLTLRLRPRSRFWFS